MNRNELEIYRDIYARSGGKNQVMIDLWDKFANCLEERGLEPEAAECLALRLVEWIRCTWGGVPIYEHHKGDPRPAIPSGETDSPLLDDGAVQTRDPLHGSRFALLRDHAVDVLAAASITRPTEIALELVRIVRTDYRGRYVPRIKRLDLLQRDLDIYRKGGTPAEMERLALQHGVSLVRIYQINKAILKDKDRREQPLLPMF